MNNKLLINGLKCLMLLGVLLQGKAVAETEGFSSSELKQIRYLSRALIKSRANEKNKLEKEIEPERKRVQAMRDSLQNLETAQLANLSNVNIQPLNNVAVSVEITVNGEDGVHQVMQSQVHEGVAFISSGISGQNNKSNKWNNKDAVLIKRTLSELTTERAKAESSLPSKYLFWKNKNNQNKRVEHVVKVTKNIEKELQYMQVAEAIDLIKIKSLKDRLTLKKPELELEELQPTVYTITKHR